MVFSKNPMPSKRFCKLWLLSVIASGLIIYPALTFGLLNLGGKLPGLDSVKKVYEVKNKIAKRFQDEPVLYVAGGSSAYFGIDAALMERRLGRPVINYGVHAGLGLDYQLFQLEKILKPGDSVLLAFELYLLADLSSRETDFLHAYVSTYDKRYLIRDGLMNLWKEIYNTPLSDWKLSMMRWGEIIEGKTEYRGNFRAPNLLIGERGDLLYKHRAIRPLKKLRFYKLGEPQEASLLNLISFCKENKIQLYFTWETVARHTGYFRENADEDINNYLSFFKNNSIIILDECTDHLYPESFYSNTFNHLNVAGRRIRTEKLIQSIQTVNASEKQNEGQQELYLIDVESHETVLFRSIREIDFEYRIYTAEKTSDDDTISEDGIQNLLNSGRPVYFNDIALKNIPAFQHAEIASVEVKSRTLQDALFRYPDHIFFLVQKGGDLPFGKNAFQDLGSLEGFFSEDGYRVAVIGTGQLSDVKRILIQNQAVTLEVNKGDYIGSFRLPFNIILKSQPFSPSDQESGRIIIGDAYFAVPENRPGIWCVVYDPELRVVSDRFFYEHPGGNIEAVLYCAKRKAQ